MSRNEKWNEIQSNLLSQAITEHKTAEEQECLELRKEQLHQMIGNELTHDAQPAVEEYLSELNLYSDRETELVYKQGFKDCVFILKSLGVLA